MALPTYIRLGWKGLSGTNALAYYEKSYLTAAKSFITFATVLYMFYDHKGMLQFEGYLMIVLS